MLLLVIRPIDIFMVIGFMRRWRTFFINCTIFVVLVLFQRTMCVLFACRYKRVSSWFSGRGCSILLLLTRMTILRFPWEIFSVTRHWCVASMICSYSSITWYFVTDRHQRKEPTHVFGSRMFRTVSVLWMENLPPNVWWLFSECLTKGRSIYTS